MGEHLLCKQGVVGSIPSSSTSFPGTTIGCERFAAFSAWFFVSRGTRLEVAASLFNNLEGKASMGLMRARGR